MVLHPRPCEHHKSQVTTGHAEIASRVCKKSVDFAYANTLYETNIKDVNEVGGANGS